MKQCGVVAQHSDVVEGIMSGFGMEVTKHNLNAVCLSTKAFMDTDYMKSVNILKANNIKINKDTHLMISTIATRIHARIAPR